MAASKKRQKRQHRAAAPRRTAGGSAVAELLLNRLYTEAHDMDRMAVVTEQLWEHRDAVPETITQRMIAGRCPFPPMEFDLLVGIAGEQAQPYLRRIAQAKAAADIVRFGAQHRAGWPEQDANSRRLQFLDSLRDGDATLVQAVSQAEDVWPPDAHTLTEVLGYLAALSSQRRRALLRRIAVELGARGSLLLHAALHLQDGAAQLATIDLLLDLHDGSAIGALQRLEKTASHVRVRAAARAAGQRLRLRLVGTAPASAPASGRPLPALDRVLMSVIDSDGGQMLFVVRHAGPETAMMMSLFLHDEWGIKNAMGSSRISVEEVDEMISDLTARQVPFALADAAAARGAVAEMVAVNAVNRHPIPPEFELWEPLLHDVYPPPEGEEAAPPELDDAPYAGRNDLVKRSRELLDHPFFETWLLDHDATIAAIMATPQPRTKRWTSRDYSGLAPHLFGPGTCLQLRLRLRRQAWLLDRAGDAAHRDIALATAAALQDPQPRSIARLPFAQALMELSVGAAISEFREALASVLGTERPEQGDEE